jgi:hypothetical protein
LSDEALATSAILITSGWGARGGARARLVREIRELNPGLIILVATDEPDALDWKSIVRAGVDDAVIVIGAANARNIARLVADRLAVPVHEESLRGILAEWPTGFGSRFVCWCLRNAIGPRSVHSMAEWFREPERSLYRHLGAKVPGPALVWRCGRVLGAQNLSELGACSQEEAARRVGYDHAAALRAVRRELRERVAGDECTRQFVRWFRGLSWSLPAEKP